jgi:hypothetical protein
MIYQRIKTQKSIIGGIYSSKVVGGLFKIKFLKYFKLKYIKQGINPFKIKKASITTIDAFHERN